MTSWWRWSSPDAKAPSPTKPAANGFFVAYSPLLHTHCMAQPKPTVHDHRIGRLAAKVLLLASRRNWTLAPWAPAFEVHAEVPRPGGADGWELDAATGLGHGWDGTTVGYFLDPAGAPAGVICAWWGESEQPHPGHMGFQEWQFDDDGDRIGIMIAPRSCAEVLQALTLTAPTDRDPG